MATNETEADSRPAADAATASSQSQLRTRNLEARTRIP